MGKRRKLHTEKLRGCKIDMKSYVWAMAERVDLASDGERERGFGMNSDDPTVPKDR